MEVAKLRLRDHDCRKVSSMGTVTLVWMPRQVHMLVFWMAASTYGTWSCKSCMTSLLFFWKRSHPLRATPLLEGSQGRVRSAQAKELWRVMLLPAHACVAVLIQSFNIVVTSAMTMVQAWTQMRMA